MSTPLKFRVWDAHNATMHIPPHKYRIGHNGRVRELSGFPLAKPEWERYEVMQYAHHTDREGDEIYEGDVLTYEQGRPREMQQGYVEFREGCFMLVDMNQTQPYRPLRAFGRGPTSDRLGTIQGDIYRNPDLEPTAR